MRINSFTKSIISVSTFSLVLFATFTLPATAEEIIARIEGMLSPGETKSYNFFVDKARTVNIHGSGVDVLEGNAQFALILIDSQGTRIDPFAQPTHPSINVQVWEGLKGGKEIRSFYINNPAVGYWTAEIALSKNAIGAQRSHLNVSCDGSDITLHQEPKDLNELLPPGEPTVIKIQLLKNGKPYLDSQAFFILRLEIKPIASKQALEDSLLELYDDGSHGDEAAGDGIYSTAFTPAYAGRYDFRINAVSPGKFERVAWRSLYVSAQGAHFTGNIKEEPIDSDRNGKYESLKLIAEVEISAIEMGEVKARLSSESGSVIGVKRDTFLDPSAQTEVSPVVTEQLPQETGVHEISLIFPGKWFLETEGDGPYFIHMEITNHELFTLRSLDELKTPYQTKPYRWQDFENPFTILKK